MSQSRHDQLIAAGWGFNPSTNRYTAPGAAQDGTATQHDQDSAWLNYSFTAAEHTPKYESSQAERQARSADPRRKEPE